MAGATRPERTRADPAVISESHEERIVFTLVCSAEDKARRAAFVPAGRHAKIQLVEIKG
jgi:hypothetical protein